MVLGTVSRRSGPLPGRIPIVTEQTASSAEQSATPTERQQATAREFVAQHGKPTKAVVEYLGRRGARVVLVAPNGRVGDVIVSTVAAGQALVDGNEDLTRAEWDADTVNATTIGSARRRGMGVSLTRR